MRLNHILLLLIVRLIASSFCWEIHKQVDAWQFNSKLFQGCNGIIQFDHVQLKHTTRADPVSSLELLSTILKQLHYLSLAGSLNLQWFSVHAQHMFRKVDCQCWYAPQHLFSKGISSSSLRIHLEHWSRLCHCQSICLLWTGPLSTNINISHLTCWFLNW